MSLSEISIRRPVFAWMLMAALIIFGAICFTKLGVSQLPDVNFPVVSISTGLNGASPEVMENQVIDVIEDAVMGIQGIRSVNSTARQSSASVSVEFEASYDIDAALLEIQSRLAQAQPLFPVNLDPVNLRKTNPEDQPILWLTVSGDKNIPPSQLMRYARDVLYDQFATVRGVGDIGLGGYVDPNLRIWVSLPKLNQYQLTATDILDSIAAEHVEIPLGRIENRTRELNLRLRGEAHSVSDFEKILVTKRRGGPIFGTLQLKDVARVEEGLADVRRYSRFNGNFTLGLGIMKQHGSNAVQVADLVKEKVAEIQSVLPKGISLGVRTDGTRFIRESVSELIFVLILSALLTSIVCYLFLGSLSSTLNVLMAIPTSIVGALIALYFLNFTLNTFTLLGLSLAIGIVVDDAIMMLENIVRHRKNGEGKMLAALNGSKEITFSAMTATIAVVAIFVPVVFMKGVIGKYFYQYGITVTVAVLLSLLEALTLTPMRCSRYLSMDRHGIGFMERAMTFLEKRYIKLLNLVLLHRKKVLSLSLILFGLSFFLIKLIPSELMPAQDQSLFMLRAKLPVGTSLPATDKKFKEIESYLNTVTEVESFFSIVGGFGGDMVNEGMIFVTLKPPSKRKATQAQIIARLRDDLKKKIKGANIVAQDLSLRGFSASRGFPIEFTLQGPDWETLGKYSEKLSDELSKTGVITDLNSDYRMGMPEVRITPVRDKLAQRGVSLKDVSRTISALLGGAVLNAGTRYTSANFDQHRYDIRLRLEAPERTASEQLKFVKVRNNRGELIPLLELVTVEEKPNLQVIMRQNRQRSVSVFGNLMPGHAQNEAIKLVQATAEKSLPKGYHISMGGNSQSFRETLESLVLAMILGIFVSYMVLASQFNSFIHPVTVLLALPFSISGAFIALWCTKQSLNMYSLIGLILLMGIVKKNSILLVDFTNQLRRQGASAKDAILSACPLRLRPILMTSIATVAGALPGALAFGPGSETRIPMSIALIGGVLLSTLLTLFIVPCAYLVFVRLEKTKYF